MFRHVFVLNDPVEVETVVIERQPLWTTSATLSGPFDIIGDVHGCLDELVGLLGELGYPVRREEAEVGARYVVEAPAGRTVVFLGDLVVAGGDNHVIMLRQIAANTPSNRLPQRLEPGDFLCLL